MTWLTYMIASTLLFGAPQVTVQEPAPNAVTITLKDIDSEYEQCIPSGFKLRYRFEMQLCRERQFWFSRCKDTRTIIRALEYDAVSQRFKLNTDQLGDEEETLTTNFDSLSPALRAISMLETVPLTRFGAPKEGLDLEKSWTLSTRVLVDCKGDYSKTLSDISYFLTLGMVRLNQYNTGWKTTKLEKLR